jgi:thymidylate kinase
MFVTIYGINNIGKTTQVELLKENLEKQGYKVFNLKYPIYDIDPSGSFLHSVLRSRQQTISEAELQMWFALNRYQFQDKLQHLLTTHDIILAEDYTYTAIAWGSCKGLEQEWIESINSKLIKSDLQILLHGERSLETIEKGHIHENQHNLATKVADKLMDLGKKQDWQLIQRQPKIEQTQQLLLDLITTQLGNKNS